MEQAQQPAVDPRPYGFWKENADQLRVDAATMSNAQLAEKYQTTPKHIKETLHRLGIKREHGRIDWPARMDELKKLAVTMTAKQLAAHFKTPLPNMYNRLFLSEIEAASGRPTHKFEGGLESFTLAATTMTEAELCAHFSIEPRTVRKHLKRLDIKCKPAEKGPRKEELQQLVAGGCGLDRLAEHYGVSKTTMRRVTQRHCIEITHAKRAPKAPRAPAAKMPTAKKPASKKAVPAKQAAPQAEVVRRPAPKPAAPKRPVQIIVPADVKVTIADFNPPPGIRICNGTQTQNYSPALHGGVMRSMR